MHAFTHTDTKIYGHTFMPTYADRYTHMNTQIYTQIQFMDVHMKAHRHRCAGVSSHTECTHIHRDTPKQLYIKPEKCTHTEPHTCIHGQIDTNTHRDTYAQRYTET